MISVTDPSLSMRMKAFGAKLLDPCSGRVIEESGQTKAKHEPAAGSTPPFRNIRRDRPFPDAESWRSAVIDLSRLTSHGQLPFSVTADSFAACLMASRMRT